MRKYLIGFLLCLLPCFVWADVDTWDGVTGIDTFDGKTGIAKICGQTVASGGGCSYMFEWHAENVDITSGTPAGCSAGDTVASANGAISLSDVQKSDGTYSVLINGAEDYYIFDISSNDLIDADDFKITFDMYIADPPSGGDGYILEIGSGNNRVYCYIGTDSRIRCYHVGQGTSDGTYVLGITNDVWRSVEYQAKVGVAGNDNYLYVSDGEGFYEADDDHVAMDTDPTTIHIGSAAYYGTIYIDNIKISKSDRY